MRHSFVVAGTGDKIPIGALTQKGLQVKTGQTHVQKDLRALLELIGEGKIDTPFLISHRLPLNRLQRAKMLTDQQKDVTKVVLKPGWQKEAA